MVSLDTAAPDFKLIEPSSGKLVARDDFRDAPALLVMFICNHCPFVKHIRKAWPNSVATTTVAAWRSWPSMPRRRQLS
jgi:hypothetical protein